MEGQIKSLQEQLDSREAIMAELVEKIGSLEVSNQSSALRIGTNFLLGKASISPYFMHFNL
jgi:hypothetical protein